MYDGQLRLTLLDQTKRSERQISSTEKRVLATPLVRWLNLGLIQLCIESIGWLAFIMPYVPTFRVLSQNVAGQRDLHWPATPTTFDSYLIGESRIGFISSAGK